jgi:hypothetical protein
MKRYTTIVVALILIIFSSCRKRTETVYVVNYQYITEQSVKNAILHETFGINQQIEHSSVIVNQEINDPQENYNGDKFNKYTGAFGWHEYTMNYDVLKPDNNLQYTATANGRYETMLMTSEDIIKNEWILSSMKADSDLYIITGESERSGSQYSKEFNDGFTSDITLNIKNIEVNRNTSAIKSGTITFTFNGISSYGNNFNSSGTIYYNDYFMSVEYND